MKVSLQRMYALGELQGTEKMILQNFSHQHFPLVELTFVFCKLGFSYVPVFNLIIIIMKIT